MFFFVHDNKVKVPSSSSVITDSQSYNYIVIFLFSADGSSRGGNITSLEFRMETFKWNGSNPGFTLIGMSIGGPPVGIWTRYGRRIPVNHTNFTITFELNMSVPNFQHIIPYTSKLVAHGIQPGYYTYEVGNVFGSNYRDSILIEGNVCVLMSWWHSGYDFGS